LFVKTQTGIVPLKLAELEFVFAVNWKPEVTYAIKEYGKLPVQML
jgi:hypothetical protein